MLNFSGMWGCRFFHFFHMKIGIKFHDIYSFLISLLMSVIVLLSAVGIISIDFVQAHSAKGRLQHFDANTVNSSWWSIEHLHDTLIIQVFLFLNHKEYCSNQLFKVFLVVKCGFIDHDGSSAVAFFLFFTTYYLWGLSTTECCWKGCW